MNNFQDDYDSWKNKLQLAQKGNSTAIQQIKKYIVPHIDQDHPLAAQLTQLIKQSQIHCLRADQTHGSYDIHSKVPIFFVIQGKAAIQCINTEGDSETISETSMIGLLQVSQTQLKIKYGQSNISLVTQFQVIAQDKTIIIEFVPKSAIPSSTTTSTISLREQAIMKKYMLIALKHITKLTYTKQKPITNKFYLLQGRACYYNKKTKSILCCYEEGYFTPSFLQNTDYALFIFQGAYIMLLEEEMLKDQLIVGLQGKRQEHIKAVQKKQEQMTKQERQKLQELIIEKYSLNRQQVNKQILGIEEKPVQKFMKSKNDFIRTSSSMKDKCGIRIRKSKKVN